MRPARALRIRRPRGALWIAAATAVALSGCVSSRASAVGSIERPQETATRLQRESQVEGPLQIRFRWELSEAGAPAEGIGVARIEPPYRARLDLYLDNLEHVVAAALVDDELRLPPGSRDDILPPVDLMWGTLGVFRPSVRGALVAGERLDNDSERLRYRLSGDEELHYEVLDGALRGVELVEDGSVVQWVRVEGPADQRYPQRVTYRNLQEFRELKIELDTMAEAEPFDPDIWDPR